MKLLLGVMGFGRRRVQQLRLGVVFLSRRLGRAGAILNLVAVRRAPAGSSAVFRLGAG